MKNSLKWTAAFLAACMMLSVGAMAEDTADETAAESTEETVEETAEESVDETTDEESAEGETETPAYTPAYVAIDGKEKVTVTSSVCDLLPDVSLDCIFDSIDESNMTVAFDDEISRKSYQRLCLRCRSRCRRYLRFPYGYGTRYCRRHQYLRHKR